MEFFVYGRNKPDAGPVRLANQDAHWDYMERYEDRLIARGPTLADDGETITGSMHLVDLADEAEADAFVRGDPFTRVGAFADVTVRRWTNALKRTMWDFESAGEDPRFLFIGAGADNPGTTALRNELLEEHRAYLNAPGRVERGILRGPLWDSAGETWVGSIFLLEAPDRAYIEAFFADEPYTKAGLYTQFEILPWRFGGRH